MSGKDDAQETRRGYHDPYTARHPVPTVQRYRAEAEERKEVAAGFNGEAADEGASKTQSAWDTARSLFYGEDVGTEAGDPSKQAHPNLAAYQGGSDSAGAQPRFDGAPEGTEQHTTFQDKSEDGGHGDRHGHRHEQGTETQKGFEDTSEVPNEQDPRKRRRNLKHRKDDRAERQVTDPVTHLPVTIHDFTKRDLKNAPENDEPPRADAKPRSSTSSSAASESQKVLDSAAQELDAAHRGMEALFPPPDFDEVRAALVGVHQLAVAVGVGSIIAIIMVLLYVQSILNLNRHSNGVERGSNVLAKTMSFIGLAVPAVLLGAAVVWALRDWIGKKVEEIWDEEVWETARQRGKQVVHSHKPESTQWLNSVLGNVWPIVNPDLFISLCDTLEDVMQASLPKLIRMVSVDDFGQGSESIRILGVTWLPKGAAHRGVSQEGHLVDGHNSNGAQDQQDRDKDRTGNNQEDAGAKVADGMEAEEGDFVNMEVAFAYKARSSGHSLRQRSKNAHLYLAFYLPAGVKIRTVRLRLQLAPDPPFFSMCTLTLLGQPKVNLSCVPLVKKGLNIMDLPLISNFVQSAVDAAMSQYVAPKSLTLDIKDMLVGDDFKKDTSALGVIIVHIRQAYDFKEGDLGIPFFKDGSADPYITVGWAKFAAPIWSTRVIESEMNPHWEETNFSLVTPDEVNADEKLRVQLWDSDRSTADDDLGRIELDLKNLMSNEKSNGKMWEREDPFRTLGCNERMPGKLIWSVGYYSKTRVLPSDLAQQSADPAINSMEELKETASRESERKFREAKKDRSDELEQQKQTDLKAREDQVIITSPPSHDYPSGILSIHIHQIKRLEFEKLNKRDAVQDEEMSDEEEGGDELPSAFCTIILNHRKIFRTRTKPKNPKPFFNAGTERFIRDWRTTEIMVAVRDARVHEDDALLGVVYLPLAEVFEHRSQVNDFYPLAGGIGYGRIRISLVFRSVQLRAPRSLLGWDYGTLEISPQAEDSDLPQDLKSHRIKFRTNLAKGKMYSRHGDGKWTTHHGKPLRLAVRKRYRTPLVIEFRTSSTFRDKTPAFGVFWLKDIPDDEEQTLSIPVFKGNLKRAEKNCMPEDSMGEKVGSLKFKMTFWRGLSGYHSHYASKDDHVKNVMEVLDAVNETKSDRSEHGSSNSDDDDDCDSNVDGSREGDITVTKNSFEDDGKRNLLDHIKDYRESRGQLHKKHRGLMQWKGPRTMRWMKHKIEQGGDKISSAFKHKEKEQGIEMEV